MFSFHLGGGFSFVFHYFPTFSDPVNALKTPANPQGISPAKSCAATHNEAVRSKEGGHRHQNRNLVRFKFFFSMLIIVGFLSHDWRSFPMTPYRNAMLINHCVYFIILNRSECGHYERTKGRKLIESLKHVN